MTMNWLVVTDLDGTLLDDGYPGRQAAAVVDQLADAHADAWIALASSKTPAEMLELAERCRSSPILIFENGSGMAWREPVLCRPGTEHRCGFEIDHFGLPYIEVLNILRMLRMRRGYEFRGFSDMTPAEIADRTGLEHSAAEKARQRAASEPLVWLDSAEALADFRTELTAAGLELVSGGRFLHVGSNLNKGRALARLWRLLRFQFGVRATTVACGDAPNDLPMMERADHAIVFPGRSGGYLEPDNPNTSRAGRSGPKAWLDAVGAILDDGYQGVMAS